MKLIFSFIIILVFGSCNHKDDIPEEIQECDSTKYVQSFLSIFKNESKHLTNCPLYNISNDTLQLSDLLSSEPNLLYVIKANSCLACVQKNLLVFKEYLETDPCIKAWLIVETLQIREIYSYYLKYELDCPIYLAKPIDRIFNNLHGNGEMLFLLDSTLRIDLFFEPVYQEPTVIKTYLSILDSRMKMFNRLKGYNEF